MIYTLSFGKYITDPEGKKVYRSFKAAVSSVDGLLELIKQEVVLDSFDYMSFGVVKMPLDNPVKEIGEEDV